jgi:uncharacterized delta-60 repeat protein
MMNKLIFLFIIFNLFLVGCTFELNTSSTLDSEKSSNINTPNVMPVKVSLKNGMTDGSKDFVTQSVDDLIINSSPDIEYMFFTNIETCSSGGEWETIAPVKRDWSFPLPEESGVVSIYGKFKTTSGLETDCFKFEFNFTNDQTITLTSPIENQNVQGYQVFHGTCKPGSKISVESSELVHIPEPISCDGQYHIGVPLSGSTQGIKTLKVVSTDIKGYKKSVVRKLNYQNNGINSGSGFDGFTMDIKIDQGLDKIYVLGEFSNYNGAPALNLIRLNPDGTVDSSFTSLGFGSSWPYSMAIDPTTHKIYVVGDFTTYGGVSANSIVRLNPDGTRDNTFTPAAPNNDIVAIDFDSVLNKIYIGGYFTNYAGSGAARISRLNIDGSRDATFNVGTGFDSDVNRIQIDPIANKIYVMGMMNYYNTSTFVPGVTRLNPDGTLDTSFKPKLDGTNPTNAIIPLPSINSVWAGGSWFRFESGSSANIASFNMTTGNLQYPWTIINNLEGECLDFALGAGGTSVFAMGSFAGIGDYSDIIYKSQDIIKVKLDGTPYPEFQTGVATNYNMGWWGRVAIDYNRNTLYVVGDIQDYNYETRNGLFAISLDDGSLK